jgi:hypothetical protein
MLCHAVCAMHAFGAAPVGQIAEFSLRNVAASWALEMLGDPPRGEPTLVGEWIPRGAKVTADFERNTVLVEGTPDDAQKVRQALGRIDVLPDSVRLEARVESSRVGRSWHTSTTLFANQPLVIEETSSGVRVEFMAANRADGRYDLWITNARGVTRAKVQLRIKPGETFYLDEGRIVSVYERRLVLTDPLPRTLDGLTVSAITTEGSHPSGQRIAFQLRRIPPSR